MPIVIPNGWCQATLTYTGSAFPATGGGTTTLGFGADLTNAEVFALVDVIAESWNQNLKDVTSDKVTLAKVTCVTADYAAEAAYSYAGSVGDDTSPPNVALLVSYRTPRRGPRGRGRSYLPGMTFDSSTNDDGTLPSAQRNALQEAVDDFFDDIESAPAGYIQYVLHNDEGSSTDGAPDVVTSRLVSNLVATQRRRLRR